MNATIKMAIEYLVVSFVLYYYYSDPEDRRRGLESTVAMPTLRTAVVEPFRTRYKTFINQGNSNQCSGLSPSY